MVEVERLKGSNEKEPECVVLSRGGKRWLGGVKKGLLCGAKGRQAGFCRGLSVEWVDSLVRAIFRSH